MFTKQPTDISWSDDYELIYKQSNRVSKINYLLLFVICNVELLLMNFHAEILDSTGVSSQLLAAAIEILWK